MSFVNQILDLKQYKSNFVVRIKGYWTTLETSDRDNLVDF